MFNPGDQLEAYTIEKCLAETGGMSLVYLAYETKRPARRVVIKVQRTGQEESLMFQDMLREEAALLQTLKHPGIVRIIPMRLDDDVAYVARAADYEERPWYYAMSYLGEYTLQRHINRFPEEARLNTQNPEEDLGVYSVDWTMELFYQLLLTVEFMHNQNLAHTDIKPDNIILRHLPSLNIVPQPILIDFGSACSIDGMKQITASAGYSPPEVMKAAKYQKSIEEADDVIPEKVDVWMLGVVLFELLTGRQMNRVKAEDVFDTSLVPVRRKQVSRFRVDVHNSIDKLLNVILSNDPQKRPSVSQIIKALDEKIFSIRPPRVNNRKIKKR